MTPTGASRCPFDFSERLDFDPSLARLMAEGPVSRIRLPYGQAEAWLVTTFDGVRQVTTDPRFSRAAIVGHDYPRLTAEPIVSPESLNVMDPPRSNRLRHAAARAFTSGPVRRMRPAIERVAARLLDDMVEHGPPADLVRHLSVRLPHHTICELLDVPEADRPLMLDRTQQMLATSPGARQTAAAAKQYLRDYFTALVAQRRTTPGDDLLSAMATPGHEDDDEPLSDDELAVLALTLILSGNDTATCQISNITYTLLTNPAPRALLQRHPERLPRVLDELLRHIPFRKGVGIPRMALRDVDLEGTRIRAGDFVHVSYLAANRDPAVFPDPDTLDFDRAPHPHMTFGWGGHHCIATALARAELETAIGALLTRFPHLRLAVPDSEVRWDTETIRRFPLRLPVSW
ncbi:cytochrome P450 [Streptomyces sp. DH12]|uniref:cytochrome P450 n=1 Tax=Streptomyces sp. DH12 TaxID=2857010 RepID=UPI001E63E423|nr:cytochrome P450 [Streptomyces sp. DH12]